MRRRSRAPDSIWSLKASPNNPIGTVAAIRYHPMRASGSDRRERSVSDPIQAPAMRHRSVQK